MPDTSIQLLYSPLDLLKVTSEKGRRVNPISAKDAPHEGMDFSAAIRTNVYNAHDGIIIYSGLLSNYGNTVVIQDRKSGQSTLYAHLDSIDLSIASKGQSVSGRVLIGKSGKSGGNYDPHFHFEILDKSISDTLRDSGTLEKEHRLNPRTYIAASPFASMLSTEVHSGELGIDAKEGDSRSNTMIRDSVGEYQGRRIIFSGLEGPDSYLLKSYFTGKRKVKLFDSDGNPLKDENGNQKYRTETHIVPSNDAVNDADLDSIIKIDGVTIKGEANPETDSNGNIVEGSWTLSSGYELHKSESGSDLILTKAGTDHTDVNTPKITIQNYPFEQNREAFGITLLGKVPDLITDANGNVVSNLGYYEPVTKSLSEKTYLVAGILPKTADGQNFIAPTVTTYFASGVDKCAVGKFNSFGEQVETLKLHDEFDVTSTQPILSYSDAAGKKLTAFPFSMARSGDEDVDYNYSKVGFAVFDEDGNRVASKIVAQGNRLEGEVQTVGEGNLLKTDQNYFYYAYNRYASNRNSAVVQKIDRNSLENVGAVEPYSANIHGPFPNYNAPSFITFPNGNKITVNVGSANFNLHLELPKTRDLTPQQVVANFDVGGGVNTIDPTLKEFYATVTQGVEGEMQMSLNPNSVAVLMGLKDSNMKISLPLDPSQYQVYSAKQSQCSADDLIKRQCDLQKSATLISDGFKKRRSRRLSDVDDYAIFNDDSITDDYYAPENDEGNSYGDDAYYGADSGDDVINDDDITLNEIDPESTVIYIPDYNQTIVLSGVNATEFVKSPQRYFAISSPTSQPSFASTMQETAASTAKQTVESTFNQTSQNTQFGTALNTESSTELLTNFPTSQPSRAATLASTELSTIQETRENTAKQTADSTVNQTQENTQFGTALNTVNSTFQSPVNDTQKDDDGYRSAQPSVYPTNLRLPTSNPSRNNETALANKTEALPDYAKALIAVFTFLAGTGIIAWFVNKFKNSYQSQNKVAVTDEKQVVERGGLNIKQISDISQIHPNEEIEKEIEMGVEVVKQKIPGAKISPRDSKEELAVRAKDVGKTRDSLSKYMYNS